MSGLFHNLAARMLSRDPGLRPRLASRFEPARSVEPAWEEYEPATVEEAGLPAEERDFIASAGAMPPFRRADDGFPAERLREASRNRHAPVGPQAAAPGTTGPITPSDPQTLQRVPVAPAASLAGGTESAALPPTAGHQPQPIHHTGPIAHSGRVGMPAPEEPFAAPIDTVAASPYGTVTPTHMHAMPVATPHDPPAPEERGRTVHPAGVTPPDRSTPPLHSAETRLRATAVGAEERENATTTPEAPVGAPEDAPEPVPLFAHAEARLQPTARIAATPPFHAIAVTPEAPTGAPEDAPMPMTPPFAHAEAWRQSASRSAATPPSLAGTPEAPAGTLEDALAPAMPLFAHAEARLQPAARSVAVTPLPTSAVGSAAATVQRIEQTRIADAPSPSAAADRGRAAAVKRIGDPTRIADAPEQRFVAEPAAPAAAPHQPAFANAGDRAATAIGLPASAAVVARLRPATVPATHDDTPEPTTVRSTTERAPQQQAHMIAQQYPALLQAGRIGEPAGDALRSVQRATRPAAHAAPTPAASLVRTGQAALPAGDPAIMRPVPDDGRPDRSELSALQRQASPLRQTIDGASETSHTAQSLSGAISLPNAIEPIEPRQSRSIETIAATQPGPMAQRVFAPSAPARAIERAAGIPGAADPAPAIRVSIGRIEVRAAAPPPPAPPRRPPAPPVSLAEYLRQRAEGSER